MEKSPILMYKVEFVVESGPGLGNGGGWGLPVDECPLGVHKVELVVESGPGLGNGGGVAQHTDGALHLGQVTARDNRWRLVVDADLHYQRGGKWGKERGGKSREENERLLIGRLTRSILILIVIRRHQSQ